MNTEGEQDEIDMLQINGQNEEISPQKQRQRRGSISADWSTYLLVATFAYFGVSVRVLLTWLSQATGNRLLDRLGDTFFLPNVFGSFILGLVNGPLLSRLLNSVKPVQTGIASGFCGSCTTFASWQLFAALRLLNGDWSTAVVQSPIIFCTSYMAAAAGRSVGQMSMRTEKEDSKGVSNDRKVLLCALTACIVLTIVVWVQIGIDEDTKSRYFWVAVALGPIGALLRYNLSLRNAKYPNFPVYTLVVNLCGCFGNIIVFVLANYLSYSRLPGDYWLATFDLWILNGVTVGLMGSLSTVSTWVNEIWKLANNGHLYYSYRYAAISVMCAQAICLSIGILYILITGRKLETDLDALHMFEVLHVF